MIYQKDWLLRQIEEMIHALVALVTGGGLESRLTAQMETDNGQHITKMLEAGEICEAENLLYEHLDGSDRQWLQIGIAFYARLNECTDSYLTEHNFSREEILDGLRHIGEVYGFDFLC